MVTISIPEYRKTPIQLKHLLLDFNGTLAVDGKLIKGVKEKLIDLSEKIIIHVLTGDTFGTATAELKGIPCKLILLKSANQREEKGKYISGLNTKSVISIGNGRNDRLLLKLSAIGIIVIQKEGASSKTLMDADIICTNILDAFDLINNPLRLKATLRN
jgi:soluble P-type ATPase